MKSHWAALLPVGGVLVSEQFEVDEFGQSVADAVEAYLVSLQAISREAEVGPVISLLLLEVSQVLLAGARLGAQTDFVPEQEFQPDVGPDPDLDQMRLRLATLLGDLDTYAHNFEPYDPDTLPAQISDDLTSIATDLANGLRHFKRGDVIGGALVVAVLLSLQLGNDRLRRARGAPLGALPRPSRHRSRG